MTDGSKAIWFKAFSKALLRDKNQHFWIKLDVRTLLIKNGRPVGVDGTFKIGRYWVISDASKWMVMSVFESEFNVIARVGKSFRAFFLIRALLVKENRHSAQSGRS